MYSRKFTITKTGIVAGLLALTILSVSSYLIVRTVLFFSADFLGYEMIAAFFLLGAEAFVLVHSFGYFLNIFRVLTHRRDQVVAAQPVSAPDAYPPVAIIVSSYKEPLSVVEDTLTCFYNLTYPNKHLYFLDDTRYDVPGGNTDKMRVYRESLDALCRKIGINLFRRKWRGAKAGMVNDFLDFVEGKPNDGFEFSHYSEVQRKEKEKYIIVFDADMNPFPDFVEPLVSIMEQQPGMAFVQTPQYYTNFETNRVARAAGLQQVVFYEYICEGKSDQDAMFCCGTNVIFRREALMDVGGFDETSVTEDFATSLQFHLKGWHSSFYNKVCAFGMGPEDLGGYFKQQFRWALGTVGLFRKIAGEFFRNPMKLPPAKWWEYFLSGTHYFVGWVFFIMMICPVLYLFLEIPKSFSRPDVYFLFFTPYIILSFSMFLWTLQQRNYRIKDLFMGVLLGAISFPVFMWASLLGMLGIKRPFGITPKGGSVSLPLTALWPQIGASLLNFGALVWGINRYIYEREPVDALLANSFWCMYHFLVLSTVIYFNKPEESVD